MLAMNWSNPVTLTTSMGPTDVIVVQFTTGAGTNANQFGNIAGAEYASNTSQRIFALSTNRCDFSAGLGMGAAGAGTTVTAPFSVGPNNSGFYPALLPNTVYYLNVKNAENPGCAASGVCNMYFQLHRPPGT
jgi:hypothetical protein